MVRETADYLLGIIIRLCDEKGIYGQRRSSLIDTVMGQLGDERGQ